MTANELRIGNLVEYPNWNNDHSKEYFKIRDIYFEDGKIGLTNGFIQLPYTKLQNIKPIPLTEEWLLKFGFEKIKDFDVYTNVWELKGFMVSLGDYINIHVDWADDGVDSYHSIIGYEEIYVHTLQNLYFALKREELIFKSE